MVHFVASLPGEVDVVTAEVAVEPALDDAEHEFTATIRIEPDIAGPPGGR
jgi:hypothetical protein